MHRVVVVVIDYCSVLYIESFKREKRCVLGGIYLSFYVYRSLSLYIYNIYIYVCVCVCVQEEKRQCNTILLSI